MEYVKTYLNDLLILTKKGFKDHLTKLEMVLVRLSTVGMRVNASKSKFFAEKIEYLGYLCITGQSHLIPRTKLIVRQFASSIGETAERKQASYIIGLL